MKEFQPGAHFNEEVPEKGRRGFLRGILAGAAGLYVGNKYLEKEKEINLFFKDFEGKEKNYEVAAKAALLLMSEMEMSNVHHVSLSGTGHPNNRIEVLRSYLTRHLNAQGIGNRYPFQKEIISGGAYTKENLQMIHNTAEYFIQSSDLKEIQRPQTPPDYSRGEV